ncbi:cell division control protein 42 homolog [Aplysia californica]|uniref:Cell division control protein 42 homolog n=1 Tax=Aplysia californica TaxID=6500 RepID=A0ABM1A293_APLCA|nr:cell division control protein 42 homolog [Aplysia californica]
MTLLLTQRAPELKCVVVGDDSVGKTSMLMGYATNRYPTQYVPSVFDNYAGSVKVAGRKVQMQIIDTVEAEENPKFRHSVYPGTDVFVVCFSVIRPDSLHHVEEVWLPEIRSHSPTTPFILVGAQADLRCVDEIVQMLSSNDQHPVSTAEGMSAAKRVGAACYIETSPEVEKNVRKLINEAIASVLRGGTAESSSCSIL